MTKKENGLLKGAIRRVFSRSELRRKILQLNSVEHMDINRKRVKKWSFCNECGVIHPSYTMAVDHIVPVIPVDSSFEEMSLDTVVDRLWCEENNLQLLCELCHDIKTRAESSLRREFKRGNKK